MIALCALALSKVMDPGWGLTFILMLQHDGLRRTLPRSLTLRQAMFRTYARRLEKTGPGDRDSARICRWIVRHRLDSGYGFSA